MDIIAKKYRVLKTLGTGAMGEVYLVLPPKGDPVALKLLRSLEAKANSEAVDQFENEFKTLKRLSHPNIGQIHDYGFDEELQKVFFTLPWLQGGEIYDATENQSFSTCEDLFVQALRALNYLHQKKLIHCDLKPGNIYVEDGRVLLIDFGLAGYWGDNIVGTPTYLAPEVFRGTHHNIASDLYAMGVIMYNCLTRSQPFSGQTLQEVYDRHRSFTPPPMHEINPQIPKYLSDIVATLLNKKPEERYQSAASVIEEIDTYSEQAYSVETEETLLSYLPTESDVTVGRQEAVEDMKSALKQFKNTHLKQPYHLVKVHGMKNVGKSRIVAKIRNELQLEKVTVENIIPPLNQEDIDVILNSKALIYENIDSYFLTGTERLNFKQATDTIEQKILSPETTRFLLVVSATKEDDFKQIETLFPEEETITTSIKLEPYSEKESAEFLKQIVGQKEIPSKFVEQFYRNTGGLPGIAIELIQSLISNGLLFDKSGRWSEDLLSELDKAFDCMEVSESLEQEFERTYNSLTGDEEDIVNWLSLCPHPLSFNQLHRLTKIEGIDKVIQTLLTKNIIREESGSYTLYRSVFQNFVEQNLPDSQVIKRHTLLAHPKTQLSKKWAIYHLSLGQDDNLKLKALSHLCKIYEKEGNREDALATYKKLLSNFKEKSIQERLDWYIEASSLMIWLDHFDDAVKMISSVEKEIQETKPQLNHVKFLTLLEKKGMALLHMGKIESAKKYFENGLNYSLKFPDAKVQQLRFENNLGEIEFLIGQHDNAIHVFKKTRDISKNLSNTHLQEITNNDLGHVYLILRKFDESLHYLKEDIQIFTPLNNRAPLARALYSFSDVLREKQDYEKAIAGYNECIRICKEEHNHPLLLRAYNGLGNLYQALKRSEESLNCYQKALDIAVRFKEYTDKAAMLYNQGYIYQQNKNFALASRRFLMAKKVLEDKPGQLLAYEEDLLSRCYDALCRLSSEDNNNMKALGFQLERLKVVEASSALAIQKFPVKYNLAELYLENRLMEQFIAQIKELETLELSEEQKTLIEELKIKQSSMESNQDQDSTGVLEIQN